MTGPVLRLAFLLAAAIWLPAAAAAAADADEPPPADVLDVERSAARAHGLAAAPGAGTEGRFVLLTMAVQGHAQSQFLLGLMQLEEAGAADDRAGALQWLERAAAKGHAGASAHLAGLAAQGDAAAHLALGLVARDIAGAESAALRHLRAAAAAGDAQGLLALGRLHGGGEGIERDEAHATRLMRAATAVAMEAVLQAHRHAAAGILGPAAAEWLELAAARTRAEHRAPPGRDWRRAELFARYWVGLTLLAGAGTAADTPRGLAHHRAAAGRGFALAEFSLGLLHERGHGVGRDLSGADAWFARAAAHGHPLADGRRAPDA